MSKQDSTKSTKTGSEATYPEASSSSVASATSSKLLPAPAPLVSAWGSKAATSAVTAPSDPPKSKSQTVAKGNWPSAADTILSKSSKETDASQTSNSSTIKPVKSTGKEKWVPYEATIVISSSTNSGNGGNKKKNSSGNNNSNKNNKNGNATSNNNGQSNRRRQNNKSNNGTNGNNNRHQNNNKNSEDRKKRETKTVPVAKLQNLDLNAPEPGSSKTSVVSSASTVPDATTAGTDVSENTVKREVKLNEQVSEDKLSSKTKTDTSDSKATDASGSNTNEPSTKNKNKVNPDQSQSGPSNPDSQHNNQFNNRRFQHRNSEPNNVYPPNPKQVRRQYQTPYNNSYRHSVAVPNTYQTPPPFGINPQFNAYGYNPVYNAPPPYFNNFGSPRSTSRSPAQDYPALNIPQEQTPFIPNPYLYSYVENPLSLVINQLNYYFSIDNLVKDLYLRKQMNSSGFVPLKKLIQFNRLNTLTSGDMGVLLEALKFTPNLELSNDKVRVRHEWEKWVLAYEQRDATGKEEEPQPNTEVST